MVIRQPYSLTREVLKLIYDYEPNDDYADRMVWHKTRFDLDVAEGEWCTKTIGYDLETVEITAVSDDGHYFYFVDDYNETLYDILYNDEWIPIIVEGNGKARRYQYMLNGDWELGSFKRLRSDILRDSCGDGLQCDESSSTCQAIVTTTTPSPTTDNSANGNSFLFSLMLASLFCFIL